MRFDSFTALASIALLLASTASGQEAVQEPVQETIHEPVQQATGEPAEAIEPLEQVAPGFRIEAAVADGVLHEPGSMAFDAAGRLLVTDRLPDGSGVVQRLEDANGDGVFEAATVFAAGLRAPHALACWDKGVFIGDLPDIVFAEDRDGDGRADRITRTFTGFGAAAPDDRISAMAWGPDLRIHGIAPAGGGAVRPAGAPGAQPRPLEGQAFAFDPLRSDIAPAGAGGTRALAFDAYGRMLTLASDGRPAVAMYEPRAGGSLLEVDPAPLSALGDGLGEDIQALCVYAGGAWPGEYHGKLIAADAATHEIRCYALAADGPALRAGAAEGTLLYRGLDSFQPRQLLAGPDGNLYILETPAGIRRIAAADAPHGGAPVPDASAREACVALLSHANAWQRETAARTIAAAQDRAYVPLLAQALRQAPRAEGRAAALELLGACGALEPELLAAALTDSAPAVRIAALPHAGARLRAGNAGPAYAAARSLAADPDLAVRLRAAFALGALPLWDRVPLYTALLRAGGANPWLRPAAAVALREGGLEVLAALSGDAAFLGEAAHEALVAQLLGQAAAEARSDDAAATLAQVLQALPGDPAARRTAWVFAAAMGACEARNSALARRIAASGSDTVSAEVLAMARGIAADTAAPERTRVAAIALASLGDPGEAAAILPGLLTPAEPIGIQLAAVQGLFTAGDGAGAAQAAIAAWAQLGPEPRVAAVMAMLERDAAILALLDAIDAGALQTRVLDAAQVQQLTKHPNAAVRERAQAFSAAIGRGPHAETVGRFRPALALRPSIERGKTLFAENCAKCHSFNGEGIAVGPDLGFTAKSGADTLLHSILDPNAIVNMQYFSYTIETNDFETVTGIIAQEGAADLLVRGPNNEERRVARDNIGSMTCADQTLMPEGWDTALGEQGIADLIAYLTETAARKQGLQ